MYLPQTAPRGQSTGRGHGRTASRGRPNRGGSRTTTAGDRRPVSRENTVTPELQNAGGNGGSPRPMTSGPREQLTRTAQDLDKDARSSFDDMRKILKTQPPWSREVEFCRQKARSLHQNLLFHHPHSPLSQSLDPLWIQTSYTLIAAFRDHVARADAAVLAAGGSNRRASDTRGADGGVARRGTGVVDQELKKILTRFRQALASEEGFYRQLIIRLARHFGLEGESSSVLHDLGMSLTPSTSRPKDDGMDARGGQGTADRPVLAKEEKKEKRALIYKALVCLGDLERYKEQYSDSYRREKAAQTDRKPLRDGNGERFTRARMYYDLARSMLPEDGSAYNQLAVIATYLGDDFSVVYNYFRALAIRIPFKGVADIVDKFLKKAYERWEEIEGDKAVSGDDVSRALAEWRKEAVVLVSILYRQVGFQDIPSLKSTLLPKLSTFLRSRQLSSETIVQLTCISIGLHWHARSIASMHIAPPGGENGVSVPGGDGNAPITSAKKAIRAQQSEDGAADWLLCVFTVLLAVAANEVESVMRNPGWNASFEEVIMDDQDGTDPHTGDARGREKVLHTYLSAVTRRILPSLRIASKWLKLHMDYLARLTAVPSNGQSQLNITIGAFWSEYYRFIEAVAQVFPLGMLPGMKEGGLEEDEDMRGFLPIARGFASVIGTGKGGQGGGRGNDGGDRAKVGGAEQAMTHPNEEQLMRIGDLQVDATLVLQAQTTGNAVTQGIAADIDETASMGASTEDDPVNMAMRASLGHDQESAYEFSQDSYQSDRLDSAPLSFAPANIHRLSLEDQGVQPNFQAWNPTVPSPRGTPSGFSSVAPQTTAAGPQSGSGQESPGLLFGNSDNIWTMTREESTSQRGQRRDASQTMSSVQPLPVHPLNGSFTPSPSQRGSHVLFKPSDSSQAGAIGTSSSADRVKALWNDPAMQNVGGMPSSGLDAAQLFAGISGLGGTAPWAGLPLPPAGLNGSPFAANMPMSGQADHGIIGPPPPTMSNKVQAGRSPADLWGASYGGSNRAYNAWNG